MKTKGSLTKKRVKKTCKTCGKMFIAKQKNAMYCSALCRQNKFNQRHKAYVSGLERELAIKKKAMKLKKQLQAMKV
ncbi:unnamed protein product [marine sediment metagenome]|uniref:Uncharacterized protein n=1 Tax=marine sediment metagenome TaxID=412755 RepID=X1QND2_9ZZZZ